MTMKTHSCSLTIASTLVLVTGCQQEPPRASPPTPVPTTEPAGAKRPTAGEKVAIASLPNLRDVGGATTRDEAVVRSGLLYRSGQLHRLPPADLEKLATLSGGLARCYDLRTDQERASRPDELPPGVKLVALDVLADADDASTRTLSEILRSPKRVSSHAGGNTGEAVELIEKTYRELVTLPSARSAYGRLFKQVAEPGGTPALFHCSTGKDRSGWAAAALLTLLGVPEDEVMRDYLASNDVVLPVYKKVSDGFIAAGGEPGAFPAVMGVRPEYLLAAMDEVKQRYGSIEGYFTKGLGIDAVGQRALREKFLQR